MAHRSSQDTGMTELKRVEINKGDVGRIIGRGGATIKMLTSSYGVRLDVPKEDTDGDGKLDVSIEGASQGVRDCLTKMAQILGYIPSPVGGAEPPSAILKKDLNAPVIREVLFFPDPTGKNFETFLAFLRSATKTIDIAAFTLSDQAISDYLIVAHKAGIRVRIVTDNETVSNKGSDCKALAKAGIAVHMDGAESFGGGDHGTESLFHHKYVILDGRVLMNGSYNYTSTARSLNSENIMITNDTFFVSTFQQHFDAVFGYFKQFKL